MSLLSLEVTEVTQVTKVPFYDDTLTVEFKSIADCISVILIFPFSVGGLPKGNSTYHILCLKSYFLPIRVLIIIIIIIIIAFIAPNA